MLALEGSWKRPRRRKIFCALCARSPQFCQPCEENCCEKLRQGTARRWQAPRPAPVYLQRGVHLRCRFPRARALLHRAHPVPGQLRATLPYDRAHPSHAARAGRFCLLNVHSLILVCAARVAHPRVLSHGAATSVVHLTPYHASRSPEHPRAPDPSCRCWTFKNGILDGAVSFFFRQLLGTRVLRYHSDSARDQHGRLQVGGTGQTRAKTATSAGADPATES